MESVSITFFRLQPFHSCHSVGIPLPHRCRFIMRISTRVPGGISPPQSTEFKLRPCLSQSVEEEKLAEGSRFQRFCISSVVPPAAQPWTLDTTSPTLFTE